MEEDYTERMKERIVYYTMEQTGYTIHTTRDYYLSIFNFSLLIALSLSPPYNLFSHGIHYHHNV